MADKSRTWKNKLEILIINCQQSSSCIINPIVISELEDRIIAVSKVPNAHPIDEILDTIITRQSTTPYLCHIRNLSELFIYIQIGPHVIQYLLTNCKKQGTDFDEILVELKFLWIKKNLPQLLNNTTENTLKNQLYNSRNVFQCNIQIIDQFISSLPLPFAISVLKEFFDCFTHDVKHLTIGDLETFLLQNLTINIGMCKKKLLCFSFIQQIDRKIGKSITSMSIYNELCSNLETMMNLWETDDIFQLIELVESEDNLQYLNSVLWIIIDYELRYDRHVFDLRKNNEHASTWPKKIHAYALQMSFPSEMNELNLNELTETINDMNRTSLTAFEQNKLLMNFETLMKMMDKFSHITEIDQLKSFMSNIKNEDYYTQIAFVIHVSNSLFGKKMHKAQRLSVLLALNSRGDSSRVLQINTGEGKTRIVSVLAVIKCLQGFKVDVITSSSELAKIQSKEMKTFYTFFHLNVACNAETTSLDYEYGQCRKLGQMLAKFFQFNPVYEADVIYGSADDFEADILRDEFDENGVRCGRKCDFAIVDEVDNMMIDGRQHLLRLSGSVPAVSYLLPVKGIIWNQVINLAKIVSCKNDHWYKLCEDENNNTVPELLNESIYDFAEKLILPLLQDHIRLDDNSTGNSLKEKLIIPKHLQNFTRSKLSRWIRNAVYAKFEMKEGREYIIKNKRIVYVDAANTGTIHDTMRWNDGLHCFLEMKHGCAVEPEHITTNFISHVTFFKRYQTNLIGLTGTIGDESTQQLFREIYSADCLIIPPFRERRHRELRPRFTYSEAVWLKYISNSSTEKLRQKRAVLIITKFIEKAKRISECLQAILPQNSIRLYTEADEKVAVTDTLEAGCVIVATNIAGRGTDIPVSKEVEENGGLHVCITFLPDNDRVERQNQGRTSRIGYRGTSQFIIDLSEATQTCQYDDKNGFQLLNDMRQYRDIIQNEMIHSALKQVNEILIKDELFQKFRDLQNVIIDPFPSDKKDAAKNALRERFGLWLIESDSKNHESLQQSFDEFKSDCSHDPENRLIDNPMYYVNMANIYLKEQKNLADAIQMLDKAIEMDRDIAASAYYSRAYARALQYKKSNDVFFLKKSIDDFKESRRIINDVLDPTLMLFPVASDTSPLHEYLLHLKNLYGTLINSINAAIGRPVDEELKNLKLQLDENKLTDDERKKLTDYLKYLEENKLSIENGILGSALNNKREIKIERIPLIESLPSIEKKELYAKEIELFETNGFIGTIIFNERKPIDWWSVIGVGLMGIGQALVGVSLAVFSAGAGAGFGLSILQEGISDLITCVKDGIINRNFSWKQWGIQKAISFAITIACAGFSALKAAARTAKNAAMTVKNAVSNGVKEIWTKSFKEGLIIGGKKLAFEGVKRAAIEVSMSLVNYGISATILPIVQECIQSGITELFKLRYKNNESLRRLMDCDAKRRNRFYASKLTQKVMNEINQPAFEQCCSSIGRILLNLTSSKVSAATATAISVSAQLTPVLKQLTTIAFLLDKEIEKLGQSEDVKKILNEVKCAEPQQSKNSNGYQTHEKQAENEQLFLTVEEFSDEITQKISKIVCQFLQCALVPPLVAAGVNGLLSNFNNNINNQLDLFHMKRNVVYHRELSEAERKEKVNDVSLTAADDEIQDLKYGAPGGIHHIGYLSDVTKRRFIIRDTNGRVEQVIGSDTSQPAVELVYIPPDTPDDIGHWTTPNGENLQNTEGFDCLFNAIGSQIGYDGQQLRQQTVTQMEQNKPQLAAAMYDIQFLRQYHNDTLFIGGAKRKNSQHMLFYDKHIANSEHQVDDYGFPSESSTENNNQTDNRYKVEGRQVPTNTIIQQMKRAHFKTMIQSAMNDPTKCGKQKRNGQLLGNGEILVTLENISITEVTPLPIPSSTNTSNSSRNSRYTAHLEIVCSATGEPLHLENVIKINPRSSSRT
ncbi:hypothetical protein I4U23_017445 [Adineta vaga]|nr:hypothetical protein I4U23_017445 [Adineta vaga]